MLWLIVSTLATISGHTRPALTKVASCTQSDSPKFVRVVKQWPLSPTVFTKDFKERYPNERNQTAIYLSLLDDVKKKKLDLVIGEGCEGDVDANFTGLFNGWNYESLRKVALTKHYDRIISHVPLKLAARFEGKLAVKCGDSESLIQEGNVRVTNLRGWAGYLTHLREKYVDDRGKLYSDGAADLLKLPRATPPEILITTIRGRMKDDLAHFRKAIFDRNDGFMKVVAGTEFKTAAIVINGLHAEDLRNKLQAAGLGCEVVEPPGYQKEDERLVQDFERLLGD